MRLRRRHRLSPEQQALIRLRAQLAALGVPVDDLSDDQLQERLEALLVAMRRAGVSMAEAGRRLNATSEKIAAQFDAASKAQQPR